MLKVVIVAGSDGTRLGDLNKEKNTKSLIFFNKRPLIAYQLDVLKKFKLNVVHLSFTDKKHIKEFKKYQKEKLVPDMNYGFSLHDPFDHPSNLFRIKKIKKFIGKSDFLFTLGDIIINEKIIQDLNSAYKKYHSSVVTKEKPRKQDKKQFILKNKFLNKIKESQKVHWRYGGIYIIVKKDINDWYKMCYSKKFKTLKFFEDCLKRKSKIYFLNNKKDYTVININTPKDFYEAKRYFKQFKDG